MPITLSDIEQTLNEADIEGLIALKFPRDEYSGEARAIADIVARRTDGDISEEELASIVSSVWNRFFGPFSAEELAGRSAGFHRVARTLQRMHSVAAS